MNDKQNCLIRFLSGPLAGQVYLFEHGVITIGRSPEASITIGDDTLSRIHAELSYSEAYDAWSIEDKNSHNGTWCQGRQLSSLVVLSNHQRIRIGNSLFEIEYKNVQEHVPGLDHKTVHFSPDEFAHFTTKEEIESAPEDLVIEEHRQLSIIYKTQNIFSKLESEKAIYHTLFETIFRELPVDDIYHLSYDEQNDDFEITRGQDAHGHAIHTQSVPISEEVLQYISVNKDSILVNDPDTYAQIRRPHHVLCAPLMNQDQLIGAIYAINFNKDRLFDDNDLTLLSGLVHSSSLSIVNCRLSRQNVINERMAALGTTAATLSHYIKNILTGIDGSMYLMKAGIDDADKDLSYEAYNILETNHQRLSGLVMDLLNLAKEDSLEFHPVNISEIIFEVTELVKHKVQEKQVEIDIDEKFFSDPTVAEIDNHAIHRVLLNLVNNAIDAIHDKYSGNSGGKITITYKIVPSHHILNLYVIDNGCGMSANELSRVFEMFYSTKNNQGTGLGLAVSKRLIKAHGGVLFAESDQDMEETRFTIKLPLTRESTKLISHTR